MKRPAPTSSAVCSSFSDAQVRKDLAYFGHFGYPGIGYRCEELIAAIRKILGTDRGWPVAMVGTGNLGRALLGYKGFGNQNFRIAAAFDTDPEKVGATIDGVKVHHLDDLADGRQAATDPPGDDCGSRGGRSSGCGSSGGGRHRRDREFRSGDARPAAGNQPCRRRFGDRTGATQLRRPESADGADAACNHIEARERLPMPAPTA